MEHAGAWVVRTVLFVAGVALGSALGVTLAMKLANVNLSNPGSN